MTMQIEKAPGIKNFFRRLRVFKRLDNTYRMITGIIAMIRLHDSRLDVIQKELDSRTPCKHCGKHLYQGVEHSQSTQGH